MEPSITKPVLYNMALQFGHQVTSILVREVQRRKAAEQRARGVPFTVPARPWRGKVASGRRTERRTAP